MLEHDYLKYWKMQDNSVIVDLGATFGDFGIHVRDDLIRTNSKMVNVEPMPFAVQQLSTLMQYDKQVHYSLLAVGVGAECGTEEFTECDASVLNHLSRIDQKFPNKEVGKFNIPIIDFPTLLDMVGGKIDFIKCDIEGAELEFFVNQKNNGLLGRVGSMAIASYHVVDGEATWKTLMPYFHSLGLSVIHEFIEGDDFSDMLYVRNLPW